MDYDRICYSKSFINQVIVRMDFLKFIDSEFLLDQEIEREIMNYFPKREKDQILRYNSLNVSFDSDNSVVSNAGGQSVEGIRKEYQSIDGRNKCIFTNQFIVFEINKYSVFEDHRKSMHGIMACLYKRCKLIPSRSGIRYINIVDANKYKIQKNYFNNEISAVLQVKLEEQKKISLVRSLHINEYRDKECTINFRYGMYNPEYPALLSDNSFVLDYDCFSAESYDDLVKWEDFIDRGHYLIQYLFEESITDSLREVMSNV